MDTRLVERHCQGCGQPFRLRRQVGEAGYNGVGGVRLCDACLAARVKAVVAEREQPRTCPLGHLLDDSTLYVSPRNPRIRHCRACRRARDAAKRQAS